MRTGVAIVLSAFLLAGCAAPQATEPAAPTVGATASVATPAAATSSAPSRTAPAPPEPEPSGAAGQFTVCPTPVDAPQCPLEPGPYTVAVHDPFSFSITDAGWQEERATAAEFESRVVLSRVDAPLQRLTFLSGDTGPAAPASLDPATFDLPGFTAGEVTDITISGTPAKYIDLELSSGQPASALTIESQTIRIEPDQHYRFTVAKIPMMEEAATVIMVTEAPVDAFPSFVTMADQVLETVRF